MRLQQILNQTIKQKVTMIPSSRVSKRKKLVKESKNKNTEEQRARELKSFTQYAKKEYSVSNLNELSAETFDQLFADYIYSLVNSELKRGSIKTKYYAICACFPTRKINRKESVYTETKETINAVLTAKAQTEIPQLLREPFKKEFLLMILASIYCDVGTPLGLLTAALFVFGVAFSLRRSELRGLKFEHLSEREINGQMCLQYLPIGARTKTHQGKLSDPALKPKFAAAIPDKRYCVLKLFRLLQFHKVHDYVFAQINDNRKPGGSWFESKQCGKQLFNRVKEVPKLLNIPGVYNVHSLKQTTATVLWWSGDFDLEQIKRTTGHRSNAALQHYLFSNPKDISKVSDTLFGENNGTNSTNSHKKLDEEEEEVCFQEEEEEEEVEQEEVEQEEEEEVEAKKRKLTHFLSNRGGKEFHFSNCNVNINIY